MTDISGYLRYLLDTGWSDLIDIRWKEKVHQELSERFPEMSEDEWHRVVNVVFFR